MQGWISLGRDRVWRLDVYTTALNTIEAGFAGGSLSAERIMDVLRDTDLNEKYLHLVEGGYLWASLDHGRQYYSELPDGVPPEMVIEAPDELSESVLRDRIAELADEIDRLDADPEQDDTGTRTFTAWVRQVVELSDEPGQTGMFAESRALLSFELQELNRDPAAKVDPAGVVGICDSMDHRARGLHAARIMNGRTAAGMAGIAALTKALMAAETEDAMIAEVAGRVLTFVALLPPGSDSVSCLSALVADSLREGSAEVVESLADAFRTAGVALLARALDSTDPSGDEFIESLHSAALEFQTCFLLARSVIEAPAEDQPPGAEEAWPETLDVAEEYTTRILSSLLEMADDTAGEQTQTLMLQIARIRHEQDAAAACHYARSLVEAEFRFPRTALAWLLGAANGEPAKRPEPADA